MALSTRGIELQVKVLTEDAEIFQRKLDETTKLVRELQDTQGIWAPGLLSTSLS